MMSQVTLEELMYRMGYKTLLSDVIVDQIICEEGGSHRDGSHPDYDFALTLDGIIRKCTLCGSVREKGVL